jgi:hypothetical protein
MMAAATEIEQTIELKPSISDEIRIQRGHWDRASGESVCEVCACLIYDHPVVPGYPWLRRRCNGRLVKV